METGACPWGVALGVGVVVSALAAVVGALCLPYVGSDPVLVGAMATRICVDPQLVVGPTLRLSVGNPATFTKFVGIDPVPVMTTLAGVPPLLAV